MASPCIILLLLLTCISVIQAHDPHHHSHTFKNSSFFTFTGLRGIFTTPTPKTFKSSKVSITEFPALEGHSVSLTILKFPPKGLNPPHVNVRASGLFMVLKGRVEVGFVDLSNKGYVQVLQEGDVFVFPKGLVHYQYNVDEGKPAMAVAAFGSTSAGTYGIPMNMFGSGIRDEILTMSFKTDIECIKKIKDGLE